MSADWFDDSRARPLGGGLAAPGGSVTDPELVSRLKGYKRSVASRYRALSSEEIEARTPYGPLLVSPKVDGELWYLLVEGGEAWLTNPAGRVLCGDLPVLAEARRAPTTGRTLVAGELFATRRGSRPRHDDLPLALSGGAQAEVARVGFMAFDLLEVGGEQPPDDYRERLEEMRRLFSGGKRLQAIRTEEAEGAPAVQRLYDEFVSSGKAEGLVLRRTDGTIYKLKPVLTLDAVVIGYTERADEPGRVRSLALALMREDGRFHVIGSCGNMPGEVRADLFGRLRAAETTASFRHASSDGALYRFVRPEVVLEIKVTDVLGEHPSGDPVMRMVCDFDAADGWRPVRQMPSVSILHPVYVRERTDKQVDAVDVRMAQVMERCAVPELETKAEAVRLPASTVLRREVYAKEAKGVTAVRKLVLFATNKHEADPSWPAFVVHFTDYSPGRKDPLKREVRLAPTLELAEGIAADLIDKNVKKGWQPVG